MRRVNIWNRLFHAGELEEQEKTYKRLGIIIDTYSSLSEKLKEATSLCELIAIHKQAWGFGYQNKNLGPCSPGMFRTKDIMEMKPEEVYLGNIWGLWTFNIPKWEENKEETMACNGFGIDGTTRCYDLVFNQYYRLLDSNFKDIYNEAIRTKATYQLCGYVKS